MKALLILLVPLLAACGGESIVTDRDGSPESLYQAITVRANDGRPVQCIVYRRVAISCDWGVTR